MATATKSNPKTTKKSTQNKPSNAPKKSMKKKSAPKKKTSNTQKHVDGNPYRAGSNYAVCFDCLATLTKDQPISRKKILEEYCKKSGKDEKRAKYDIAVVLSPSKEGAGHRSSRKEAYWVEKFEDGFVKLRMSKKGDI